VRSPVRSLVRLLKGVIPLSTESFRTPEGFELPKRLLLPDVRTFGELFTYVREWDHATMTSGPRQADATLIPRSVRVDLMDIGPFLSGTIGGVRRAMAIVATTATVNALATPSPLFATLVHEGVMSFELFEHKANGRVLVTAQINTLSSSLYVAYIDPASIPAPGEAPWKHWDVNGALVGPEPEVGGPVYIDMGDGVDGGETTGTLRAIDAAGVQLDGQPVIGWNTITHIESISTPEGR
jgi:hypothetical protein